jgi:AcrR family transcriptional regulator
MVKRRSVAKPSGGRAANGERKDGRTGNGNGKPPSHAIAQAAFDLFARQGFNVTTVRDIMHACGLTQGALYNHFSSKDQLLATLIIQTQSDLERELDAAVAKAGPDVVDQLFAYVRCYALRHTRNRTEALVANREFVWLEPTKRNEVRISRRRVRDILNGILRRGLKEKAFSLPRVDGKEDAKIIAMAILNTCTYISQWFTGGGAWSDETIADYHAVMSLRLVGLMERK